MKILVHPHLMEIGGSQLNAIEFAAATADRGHEVVLYCPDGVLVEEARQRGLEVVLSPPRKMTPNPASARALVRLVRERGFDLVHAYEWDATLDTMYGPGWMLGTPVLSTILSMDLPYFLPRSVPMILGTRELVETESRVRPEVYLGEPPVDLVLNRPGCAPTMTWDGREVRVRDRWGIEDSETLIVVVGRLANQLKLSGLIEAIAAMGKVAASRRARLLIVGDGPERATVARAAEALNSAQGSDVVILAGSMDDPRPAYDAADIMLGMGGSILRAMAFGKPVCVQGEKGFWSGVSPETIPYFLRHGWYGLGDGTSGVDRLAGLILDILGDPTRAETNAGLGQRIVLQHYSLQRLTEDLEQIYLRIVRRDVPVLFRARCAIESMATLTKFHAHQRLIARRRRP